LPPHKTLRTSVGQTLRSVLVEALLCIGSATVLPIGCQLEDTYCRCCFASTGRFCFVEAVVASATVEAPAIRAHVPTDEGVLLLSTAPPELLFLVQFVAAMT
jgi:hypothetical protein